jgi:hypothetical protein
VIDAPDLRALLAVDVVGASGSPTAQLAQIPVAVAEIVRDGLAAAGVRMRDATRTRPTGDGLLTAFPVRFLGGLVDAAHHFDELSERWNASRRPDVRLRVAVHVGAVPDADGLHRPNVHLVRLLDSPVLRGIVERCTGLRRSFGAALIMSGAAHQVVFEGGLAERVAEEEFAQVPISSKELVCAAWVRVPGVHPEHLVPAAGPEPAAEPVDAREAGYVHNHVTGNNHGVQTGVVQGDVRLGRY